ncbi:MAG: helix-turn-helix domain-containing protein [Gemmatimonadaceae bacterium]
MRLRKPARKEISVTRGSGNVFADLGLPNPEERLAKAQLAHAISRVIKERGLTQREAAALMGIDQPKVSHVLRGRLADFSTERLMGFLTGLGRDVEIVVKVPPRSRKKGRLRVAAA